MPLSNTDVEYAYRLIFGRSPESDQAIKHHATTCDSLLQLRESFLQSAEFTHLMTTSGFTKREFQQVTPEQLQNTKLVFVHLPKTAGTTLHEILTKQFQPDEICPERFNGLSAYTAGALANWKLFSGHFDFANTQLIPGKRLLITCLRDPEKRLNSLYHFLRAHQPEIIARDKLRLAHLANTCDPLAFFAHEEVRTHPSINNSMTQVLAGSFGIYRWEMANDRPSTPAYKLDFGRLLKRAIANLDQFAAVGITERFGESLEYILSTANLPVPVEYEKHMVLEKISKNNPYLRPIERHAFSPEVVELIAPLIRYDKDLYKKANARLDAFCKHHNATPRRIANVILNSMARLVRIK